jgi:Invasion associated locus B (IalB) protein
MGRILVAFILLTLLSSPPVSAQQKQAAKAGGNAFEIGKAGAWGIFTSGEGRAKTCFIMAGPAERLPKGLTRDPATMFISMRQGEPNKMEFSMLTGYPLKQNTEASIAVGAASFSAIGQAKNVWLKNASEEGKLIGELRKGSALSVKGTSLRGNETTDRYSLTGFGQALERAQKECS